jgi:hypothetical protein
LTRYLIAGEMGKSIIAGILLSLYRRNVACQIFAAGVKEFSGARIPFGLTCLIFQVILKASAEVEMATRRYIIQALIYPGDEKRVRGRVSGLGGYARTNA